MQAWIKFTPTIFFIVLLTEADPGGELTEGGCIWVVAVSFEQFKASINEGLQHCHARHGAWFRPLGLSYSSVNRQGGEGFVPVYWLIGKFERKEKNIAEVTYSGFTEKCKLQRVKESSEPFTKLILSAGSKQWTVHQSQHRSERTHSCSWYIKWQKEISTFGHSEKSAVYIHLSINNV